MVMKECPKCGSSNIEEGKIIGGPKPTMLSFRSNNDKSFVPITPKVNSWVCFNCGYIETYAEKTYLEKLEQKLSK